MRRISLLVLVLAALAPTRGAAQRIDSPYRFLEKAQSVEVFGGYLETERGALGAGPHSAPLIGVRYGGRLSGPVVLGASVSFVPAQRTVFDFDDDDDVLVPLGDIDFPILLGEAGLRFYLPGERTWHGLAPYLGASLGVIGDVASTHDLEADLDPEELVDFGPTFAVSGSVGTDWFLTERFSLRAAAVTQLWRFTSPAGLAGAEETEWLNNYGGTLGVAFHF